MKVDDYIRLGLAHEIHTSTRRSFRSCRRRWDWNYRQGYYPKVTPQPLEFGVAFHEAMEVYYDPKLWSRENIVKQGLALVRFRTKCDDQLKNYIRLNGEPSVEVIDEYLDRVKIGLNMIRYYTEFVSPNVDVGFIPTAVEFPFKVPIINPDNGEQLYCKCDQCHHKLVLSGHHVNNWDGLPVTYAGRVDMLAIDERNKYWAFDWKCLSKDSKIITPDGWKTIEEIDAGDEVIGVNGKPVTVIAAKDQGEKEVYEVVFTDGTVVKCSGDHLWKVHNSHSDKDEIVTTVQIMNKPSYVRYSIDPIGGPVEFNSSEAMLNYDLPLHPYVLGSLIGDGCFTGSVLTYSSQSGETVELLKKYATPDVSFVDQRHHGANKWQINGYWRDVLRSMGIWGKHAGEKWIPPDYLYSSVENRVLLLQGLCDTDGNTGLLRWTTTSPQLAQDFCRLVWSLGGTADTSVSKQRLHQNGTTINVPQYSINYTFSTDIEPNQLERKRVGQPLRQRKTRRRIKEVRKTNRVESMKCIYVDSPEHLFATENFILTHNTTNRLLDEDAEASFLQLDDQVSSYVWALRVLGIPVIGFVYVEIRKTYPQVPEELSKLYGGRRYSTNRQHYTNADVYRRYVAEHDPIAYAEGKYNNHIEWLSREGPKFHQRHQVHKNEHEITEIGRNIWLEAQDIIGDPRIYPQPGRFSCTTCLYRQPCIGQNQGEDYSYTLETMFERRKKHYYEEKRSTE